MGLKFGMDLELASYQCTKQFGVVTLKTRPWAASGSWTGELGALCNICGNYRLSLFFIAAEPLEITPTNHISLERYGRGGSYGIEKNKFWVT